LLENPECKNIQDSEKLQGKLCLLAQAQICSKILNGNKYIQCSETFQGKLCFSGQMQIATHLQPMCVVIQRAMNL